MGREWAERGARYESRGGEEEVEMEEGDPIEMNSRPDFRVKLKGADQSSCI